MIEFARENKVLLIILLLIIITIGIIAYIKESAKPTKDVKSKCVIEENEYMGRVVYTIKPRNEENKSDKVILYIHGGAYVADMTSEHWSFIKNLVEDTNATVVLPSYPLTPQYNYKDVFNMVEPFYKELIKKVDTKNLVIMGDSAGAGLSLALEEKLASQNVALPNQTILISPWLDVSMSNSKIKEVAPYDHDLTKEKLLIAGRLYSNDLDEKNPLVSPLYGDLSGLSNITIFTGTYDILNPDVHVLQEKAKEIGLDIQVKEYEKASHIWIINRNCDNKLVEDAYRELIQLI